MKRESIQKKMIQNITFVSTKHSPSLWHGMEIQNEPCNAINLMDMEKDISK